MKIIKLTKTMERNSLEDVEDNETCAPEIICGSAGNSFNDSDLSNDPISQSSNVFEMPQPREKKSSLRINPILQALSQKSNLVCRNCNRKCNKAFNIPCSCNYIQSKSPTDISGLELEEEFEMSPRKNIEKIEKSKQSTGKVCTSCRKVGHSAKECPIDPNTRTGINPIAELQRISNLKSNKNTKKNISTTRNYDDLKEGFNDIASLKATIKAKIVYQEETGIRPLVSLNTEEAELMNLKPRK
jgi:hypothetical protein